ncbi:hypothetical protein EHR01_06565 [Leptospira mtsangambouensis]|uniref:Uncharacterized protein n=1 Tax=Leptospira mtsangambouensis TaxID=2484912 RepID=A0ABY2P522_9LEPT|nr:hypothetical protein EHR01_06565 [Leptospira mtsangambouensis]
MHPQTTCQSLTSRLRDSGSGNVVSPSSLIAIGQSVEENAQIFLCECCRFRLEEIQRCVTPFTLLKRFVLSKK